MSDNRLRVSYGVAMCRYNKSKNNQVEILMIKKRYTYQYFSFIFGHYKKQNTKHLQYLFNNMTFSEKIDILNMKFSTMWYRIWLTYPELQNYNDNSSYFKKKAKFENIFLKDVKRLKDLINNSSNSVTPWEIPKGMSNANELNLNCAMREFEEETGIYPNNYNMLWDVNPVLSFYKDDNVIYKGIYYIAYLNKTSKWDPKVNFDNYNQVSEVEQIQWVTIDEIKFLNLNEVSKTRLILMCKNIVKRFKSKIKSYYYI